MPQKYKQNKFKIAICAPSRKSAKHGKCVFAARLWKLQLKTQWKRPQRHFALRQPHYFFKRSLDVLALFYFDRKKFCLYRLRTRIMLSSEFGARFNYNWRIRIYLLHIILTALRKITYLVKKIFNKIMRTVSLWESILMSMFRPHFFGLLQKNLQKDGFERRSYKKGDNGKAVTQ